MSVQAACLRHSPDEHGYATGVLTAIARSAVGQLLVVGVIMVTLSSCTLSAEKPSMSNLVTPSHNLDDGPKGDFNPTVVISLASLDLAGLDLTVGGFVTLIEESNGECVYLLSPRISGTQVTRTVAGVANHETTSCGSVDIPLAELTKGVWEVSLQYQSIDEELTSDPVTVEIP